MDNLTEPTDPTLADSSEHTSTFGDFRVIREIGHGGMGIVYEAEQVSLGRRVALKVLTKQMLADDQMRRRFEREARAAARLHHTNIVPVFGFGEHQGMPFYVMQYIQGLGLHEVLDELKRLCESGQVTNLAKAVLSPPQRELDHKAQDLARSLLVGTFALSRTNPPATVAVTSHAGSSEHPKLDRISRKPATFSARFVTCRRKPSRDRPIIAAISTPLD